jgi:sec-independent protein translocase protein TatB
MFDIGIGEIAILAVIGLLVFGPEKLPKAAADAARMLRQVRGMAANARKDLADSAGVDFTEAIDSVRGLSDLHPRNLAAGFLSDEGGTPGSTGAPGSKPTTRNGSAGPRFDPDAT